MYSWRCDAIFTGINRWSMESPHKGSAMRNSFPCHALIMICHYNDVIMGAIASQINSLASVYSAAQLGADQRKHQSSALLAFVRGIHRRPVNSPHKGPVTRKMVPFDDVIMQQRRLCWKRRWPERYPIICWYSLCLYIIYTFSYATHGDHILL